MTSVYKASACAREKIWPDLTAGLPTVRRDASVAEDEDDQSQTGGDEQRADPIQPPEGALAHANEKPVWTAHLSSSSYGSSGLMETNPPTQQRKLSPVRNQNVERHVSLPDVRHAPRAEQRNHSLRDLRENATDNLPYRTPNGRARSEGRERDGPHMRGREGVRENPE